MKPQDKILKTERIEEKINQDIKRKRIVFGDTKKGVINLWIIKVKLIVIIYEYFKKIYR